MKILSFGEVLWDVFSNCEFIGGAPLNFAAHLAKMGEDVYILTSVGNDKLGSKTLKEINSFKVNCDYINVSKKLETGKCLVSLDSNKIPHYNLLNNVAYNEILCENIPDNFDVLYFGTLALRSEFNLKSVKKLIEINDFKEIFVDINIRPPFFTNDTINFALNNATIIKISAEELSYVTCACNVNFDGDYEKFTKLLADKFNNLKLVIITLGDQGAVCLDVNNNIFYKTACVKVDVVSTVGAGDSFSAGFVFKYLSGCEIEKCIRFAAKISAFVVSSSETVPNYNPVDFE